ncbi:MAG: FAD/NAD(P)-binding oxidoreductase, partial [Sedimenticola sp.]|nr:FAD/NAD(P)-binding oxidoreductase [Sedimenticola sp.]
MTTGILALVIFTAIVAQVTIIMLISLYRRRRQFKTGSSATPKAQPSATPDAPATAEANAWKGFREFVVQRRELEDAQASICSFYLAPVDGKPLPPFQAGQFLTFKLDIEAPAPQTGKSVIRCYSLSDSPDPNHYRVSIKRVPAPADRPELSAGVSSNYFHDQVMEGTHLQVRAPS